MIPLLSAGYFVKTAMTADSVTEPQLLDAIPVIGSAIALPVGGLLGCTGATHVLSGLGGGPTTPH